MNPEPCEHYMREIEEERLSWYPIVNGERLAEMRCSRHGGLIVLRSDAASWSPEMEVEEQ